jgi:hypothetical protein
MLPHNARAQLRADQIEASAQRSQSLARLSPATHVGLLARRDRALRPYRFEMGPDPLKQFFAHDLTRRYRKNDLLARVNRRV